MTINFAKNKKEKLIIALDFPDLVLAKKMVDDLGDEIIFYKIGLEMMASGDYFKMIEYLKNKNKKVFADLKLYDIPATVGRAVKNLAQYEIDLLTIHAANSDIMREAAQNKGKMNILAVTVLTCFEKSDLEEMGFSREISLADLVLKKAELALNCGVDGVVASVLETELLRKKLGDNFLIATPGIRIDKSLHGDQKRVADVDTALKMGANFLVVGRPITQSQDPHATAKVFNQMIF